MIEKIKQWIAEWLQDYLPKERIKVVIHETPVIKDEPEEVIKKPKKCQRKNCSEKISLMSYHCKYCGGYYCDKHRIPEEHHCGGVLTNPYLYRNREISINFYNYDNDYDDDDDEEYDD